jgi:hypothetical protein
LKLVVEHLELDRASEHAPAGVHLLGPQLGRLDSRLVERLHRARLVDDGADDDRLAAGCLVVDPGSGAGDAAGADHPEDETERPHDHGCCSDPMTTDHGTPLVATAVDPAVER